MVMLMDEAREVTTSDIGWKQFALGVLDLIRWPSTVVFVILILRAPLFALLEAITFVIK